MLAILYVALIVLLLIDSARELGEARRFRAKVVAATLAENGAELAAASIVTKDSANVNDSDAQGTIFGHMTKTANQFQIRGEGSTAGLVRTTARVQLQGRIEGNKVKIDYAVHTP